MIYLLLSGFYLAALMMSPILHAVILTVGGWQTFAWTPMTALTTGVRDVVNQHFGKDKTKQMVLAALIIRAIFYIGIFPILFFLPHVVDLGLTKMFTQTIRNFLVSEGTTLLIIYFIGIPMFSHMKAAFSVKYSVTGIATTLLKGGLQTVLMYAGVVEVNLRELIMTDLPTKLFFLFLGLPFAVLLNYVVNKWITHKV